jgi:hypothetical protein
MFTLIKHHFQTIDLTSLIVIPVFFFVLYIVHIPPTFLFVVTVISLPIIIYFLNHKNKVDHFLISLPVEKKTIIRSRYLFTVIMGAIILLFQLVLMFVMTTLFDGTQYVYNLKDMIVLLCLATIVPAIAIPIYHLIRSFVLATTMIAIFFFISMFFTLSQLINVIEMGDIIIFNDLDPGLAMLVEKIIPYQTYPILVIISIVIFHISIFTSQRLYTLRDIKS